MSDPFQHVRENQAFRPSARAWNAFIDTAIAHRMRAEGNDGLQFGQFRPWVLVYNASPFDFDRFDAIGINGPVIEPAENLEEFENNLTFEGTIPRACHVGKFGICLEAIPAGGWGRVLLSGVIQCWVDFDEYGDGLGFADVQNGFTSLRAGYTGSAQILWAAGRNGLQRAIVRLSNNPDALLTSVCSSSSFSTSETSSFTSSSSQTSQSTSAATSEQTSSSGASSSQTSASSSPAGSSSSLESSSSTGSSSGTSQSSSPATSESSSAGSSSQTSESTSSSLVTSSSGTSSSQTSASSSGLSSSSTSESSSSAGSSSAVSSSSSSAICVGGIGGIAWDQLPIAGSADYLLGIDAFGCLVRIPASLCCHGLSSSDSHVSSSLLTSVSNSLGPDG